MAFKVIVFSGAQRDILEALDWYESKQNGLRKRFYKEYSQTIAYLKRNPRLFSRKQHTFREAKLKNFPYVLIFEIMASNVIVHAVFNTYENPNKKSNL